MTTHVSKLRQAILIAGFVALALAGCSATNPWPGEWRRDCSGQEGVRVYFVSLSVETYFPITKEIIDKGKGHCSVIGQDDKRLAAILSLFKTTRANNFDNLITRVKIDFGDEEPPIHIDRDGHVEQGDLFYTVERADLDRLERLLGSIVYGRNPGAN